MKNRNELIKDLVQRELTNYPASVLPIVVQELQQEVERYMSAGLVAYASWGELYGKNVPSDVEVITAYFDAHDYSWLEAAHAEAVRTGEIA